MSPFVVILVLNWNSGEDTLRCIRSLEPQSYGNFRILVIDNGSTDGSAARLRAAIGTSERIALIENPVNLGYAGGNNLGMQRALTEGADYIWLFNNDAVAEPDTLARLVAAAEADPRIGLLSPLIREDGGAVVQFAGGRIDLDLPSYTPTQEIAQGRAWQDSAPDRVVLWGTAMLVRRATAERIGLLNEGLFAYWEDIDYSIRSMNAGFRNTLVFDTAIFHAPKPTIDDPLQVKPYYFYFMARNELLLWRKFCRPWQQLRATSWSLRRQVAQLAHMQASAAHVDAVRAGIWDGICGRHGPYRPPGAIRRQAGGAILSVAKRVFATASA
ncbi:MAG: glycosyltransferase family 2 protein [Rhodospirillales bacterium]|nr:glycosyltransferase family 2 protein [Rhodospirillales bacterium]